MVNLACVDGEENTVPFQREMLGQPFTIVLNLFKSNLNASRTTKPPAALYVPGVSEGRNSFWQSHLCLGGIAELWFKQ